MLFKNHYNLKLSSQLCEFLKKEFSLNDQAINLAIKKSEFEFAPIGYCEIKIKDIILRNRIKLFLNKLENDIFDLELSNNNVKYTSQQYIIKDYRLSLTL